MLYKISFFIFVAGLAILLVGCRPPGPATLAVAIDDDIISLDPHAHDDEVTGSVLFNIYQGLVAFDPQMRVVPQLALSW
jgi:ABC-type transport system substrate-binding protein